MPDNIKWDDVFPPLDISAVARAVAEMCRRAWEESDRAVSPYWHGRPPVYPFGTFESLYSNIVEYLKEYDAGRTRALEFYKQELINVINRTPRPILLEKPNA